MESPLSRQYVKLCDRTDFDDPVVRTRIREIAPGLSSEEELHRKLWEFALLTLFLEDMGHLNEHARILAVGAGREQVLFWLAGRAGRVVATDIYGHGDFAEGEANAAFLADPAAHAPYPYPQERLEVRHMDARALDYPSASFDAVFSLSSIEHFGGPRDVARAAAEIGRVVRPGGHAAIVTECFVRRPRPADWAPLHVGARLVTRGRRGANAGLRRRAIDVFTPGELQRRIVGPSGLELLQPLDRRLSAATFDNITRIGPNGSLAPASGKISPHILLRARGAPWTSAFVALRKRSEPH